MQKRETYNPKDGYILGLLGVLTPVIAYVVIGTLMVFVAFGAGAGYEQLFDSTAFKYITQALLEIMFVVVLLVYNKTTKVNYVSASLMKTKPRYLNIAFAIVIGVALSIFFGPLIELWERLLKLIGVYLPQLSIPLNTPVDLILAIVIMGIIPAFCEEAVFRGGVLNGLREKGVWFAVLYSSMCFALMHTNLQQIPYTFLLGLIIGWVVYYTRSIWLGILIHLLNNVTVLCVGYFSGDAADVPTSLTTADIVYAILMTLVGVGLVVLTMWVVRRYNRSEEISTPMKAEPKQPVNKPKDTLCIVVNICIVLVGTVLTILRAFNKW